MVGCVKALEKEGATKVLIYVAEGSKLLLFLQTFEIRNATCLANPEQHRTTSENFLISKPGSE